MNRSSNNAVSASTICVQLFHTSTRSDMTAIFRRQMIVCKISMWKVCVFYQDTRIISSSRARSRWFSWTSSTSLMAFFWKPISLNWFSRCRNSFASRKKTFTFFKVSNQTDFIRRKVPSFVVSDNFKDLPLFHSFETSPRPLPPGTCHNPADTSGHTPPDNSRSAKYSFIQDGQEKSCHMEKVIDCFQSDSINTVAEYNNLSFICI